MIPRIHIPVPPSLLPSLPPSLPPYPINSPVVIKFPPLWWIDTHILELCLGETEGGPVVRHEASALEGEGDDRDTGGVVARVFLGGAGGREGGRERGIR